MPGTPATTPRLAIPRYASADAPSFSAQTNAITDMVDSKVDKIVPVVSTFPTTGLVDGQEVYFQNSAMASVGAMWRMRYRLAATRWEFEGGAPLYASNAASLAATVNGAWFDPPGAVVPDCAILVPFTGLYVVRYRFRFIISNDISGPSFSEEIGTVGLATWGASPGGDTHGSIYSVAKNIGSSHYSTIDIHTQLNMNVDEVWGLRYLRTVIQASAGAAFRERVFMILPVYKS